MGQWLEKARPLLSLVTPSPLPRWQERSSHHPPRPAWDSRSQLDVVGQASLEAGSGFSVEPGGPQPTGPSPSPPACPSLRDPLTMLAVHKAKQGNHRQAARRPQPSRARHSVWAPGTL